MTASHPAGGVFISYAREDTDAARRVADALRAAGVEVWFDQSELRGGDAWDAKIRGQIETCELFLPIISAHTEARRKGYFRLEWNLADEMTHQMAAGTPFIVPIVIDATAERGALVPKSFLSVQWTRLPGGETPVGFAERVQVLLAGTPPAVSAIARGASSPASRQRAFPRLAAAIVVTTIGVGAYFAQRKTTMGTSAGVVAAKTPAPPSSANPRLDVKSIAVLPFVNMSADTDSRVFADGMHEDILTHLGLIHDLRVVPRTSVEQYRETKKSARQIGTELNVAYLLEGSVRRAGNSVRVTGKLLRVATDEQVSAWNLDRELKDIFAIQTAIATEIAAALHSVLSPQAKNLIERQPTANLDAYDLYLKARSIYNVRGNTAPGLIEQAEWIEKAVALDPKFGVAWAKLAWCHSLFYYRNIDRTEARVTQARDALANAERLIPGSPEVFLGRGYYYHYVARDVSRGMEEFRHATEFSPNSTEALHAIGNINREQGDFHTALKIFHQLETLDPANPEFPNEIFLISLAGRRYEDAVSALRRAESRGRTGPQMRECKILITFLAGGELERDVFESGLTPTFGRELALMSGQHRGLNSKNEIQVTAPPNAPTELQTAFAAVTAGSAPAVQAVLEELAGQLRRRIDRQVTNALLWSDLGVVEALRGNRAEALACTNKAIELTREPADLWTGPLYRINLATVYAWIGELEKAVEECRWLLRTPFHRRGLLNRGLKLNVFAMRNHPAFAPLRGDPRFEALLNDPKNNAPLF